MYPDTNFYKGQTYFVGSDGRKIPLRVESVDFDLRYIGPKITGCLLYDSSYPDSKKSDSLIKKVIFNDPATIVIWSDNSKTVVKCQEGDTYDAEKGLALCIAKKYLGNKGNFNEVFKKWIPEESIEVPKIGTRIKIIDAGNGAYGVNGNIGVVTNKRNTDGLLETNPGYNVDIGCRVWRINLDADVEEV